MKVILIELALNSLKSFFLNPKNKAIREFLSKDKTQKTFADIYEGYLKLLDEIEDQ